MKDIFISYAKEDRATTESLAKLFTDQGWSVWWDRDIPLGKEYDRAIEKALTSAKCVVVLWSETSVDSDWVRTEAEVAHDRQTIMPALIDDVTPPLAFRRIQAADLTSWKGESDSPEIQLLLNEISKLVSPRPVDEVRPEPEPQPAAALAPRRYNRWIATASVLLVLIGAAAWWMNAPDDPGTARTATLTPEAQAQVESLLQIGESHLEVGFLIEPPGSNAYDSYEQVLKLDPNNQRAKAAIRRIGDRLEETARQTFERGDIEDSLKLIDEGLRIFPNHAGLRGLKRTITRDRPR